MAFHLYNHLMPNFTHSAHITLGLDEGSSNASMHLKSILEQLGMTNVRSGANAPELTQQLRDFARERQVLLVLDNVSSSQQLDALLPIHVGQGSIAIVTSRQSKMPEYYSWKQVISL
jgi:hypothetical protein